ncbi:MAG: GHKL domain-containing protein [Desulfobacterales bacterium]|uniref:histidine kinase n=1 Tax=Candidatus Desulfatibia vada TaxID=2841696 RepID=A0A8J6TQQ0_9BACT|nr:GHKL domain-containing protein [Candidatus Desulfatibia vada]
MTASHTNPMLKEVCCKNWAQLFNYIETTPIFPSGLSGRAAVLKLIDGLVDNPEYLISDPDDAGLAYPVKEEHLKDDRYWHSNEFSLQLFENASQAIGGYRPLFQAGIIAGYRMLEAAQPKRFQLLRIFSPKKLLKILIPINKKLNKLKDPNLIEYRRGFSRVKLNYKDEYKGKISQHVCDWNAGIYTGMGKFTGAYDLVVIETECVNKGGDDCIFELHWTHHYKFRRFMIFCHSMIDPEYITARDYDNLILNYLSLSQEGIINDRTAKLKETQAKLVEAEKKSVEHRITGGFAHEMRNALTGAQLELKTALNYNNMDKSCAAVLQDSATALLKSVSRIHEEYNIPKEKIVQDFIPELKTIANIAYHINVTLSSVSKDLDRGQSITSQIRDYAKMSEIKAGDTPVELVELLNEYEQRFSQDFEKIGIKYSVTGAERAVVVADETHMNSIFSNLILNAKDAISEIETDCGEINVLLEKRNHKDKNTIIIKVQDNGAGIQPDHLNEIFEPFFSTKPKSGTGLGLGVVKRLVQLYDGQIEVASESGKGTVFMVTLPETPHLL